MLEKCINGCLGKNTRILMADQSAREIHSIRPGDRVSSYNGRGSRVIDIISGYEDTLFRLTVSSGESVAVTGQHPVMKAGNEWAIAEELKIHDVICINGGTAEVTAIEQTPYNDIVYNLILEGEMQAYVANGFVVGDFNTQNNVMCASEKKRRAKAQEDNRLKEEIEKIKKEFKY